MNLKNKRILVLGNRGFFGSNLIKKLKQDKYNYFFLKKNCDLLDFKKSYLEIKKINPQIIINCAGKVGGLHYNIHKQSEIFYNNIKILLNVLEISSLLKVKRLVNIGSSCSYPVTIKKKLKENMLFTGKLHKTVEAYGFWKLASILGSRAYKREKHLKSQNIIFPSLYGPNDKFDKINSHVVSALVCKFHEAKLKNKKKVILWGDGSPIREFMFIEDAVEGLLNIIKIYDSIDPLNLGSGKGYSIKKIADLISAGFEYKGKIYWDKKKPNGSKSKILDIVNQKKISNWKPKITLDKGINLTINWYKNQYLKIKNPT